MGFRRRLPVLAVLGLAACQAPEHAVPAETSADQAKALPPLPVAEPPLDREALLLAVARAASAAALGQADPGQRQLDGRRFELRMRFGCGGPVQEGSAESRRVSFDEGKRVLRISVAPDISATEPPLESVVGAGFEDAEGFWILRPWLLQPACPRSGTEDMEAAGEDLGTPREPGRERPQGTAPHIGIAQFFTAADARTHRRDRRSFSVTKVLSAEEAPSGSGYDLVVSGRLRQLPDGRVIACIGDGAIAPPTCILSAQFDRVAVEQANSRRIVAEWSTG